MIFPKSDLLLITHNHYDHMDMASLRALVLRDNPLVLTPLGNDTIMSPNTGNACCWGVGGYAGPYYSR